MNLPILRNLFNPNSPLYNLKMQIKVSIKRIHLGIENYFQVFHFHLNLFMVCLGLIRVCLVILGFLLKGTWKHGHLSLNTETLLYVVLPCSYRTYNYCYYVKTLTTYFRHLEFKIRFDWFLNLKLAKFLCIINTYHIIEHFELL